jgi:hypothetical protein
MEDPILVASPYTVRSKVSLGDFRTFVSALEEALVPITNDNMGGLSRLCEEFHFGALAERLSQFRESDDFKDDGTLKDFEVRKRLSALEERMQQHNCEIAALQTELLQHLRVHESSSEALFGRVAHLEASCLSHSTVSTEQSPPASIVPSPSMAPAAPAFPLATPPSGSVLQAVVPIASAPAPTSPAPPSGWNSTIVPDLPDLFVDFKEKQFTLLWRGSRDGFGASDFHNRCNGHPNTLTAILDTRGNIFGGFTPLEWESSKKRWLRDNEPFFKADPSLKSFLFTLKNPHNIPARRFALKAERKDRAISCNSECGPGFWDIGVRDNCNANTDSYTQLFGIVYTNDTGLDAKTVFTGSKEFQVKEIEVFEVTE